MHDVNSTPPASDKFLVISFKILKILSQIGKVVNQRKRWLSSFNDLCENEVDFMEIKDPQFKHWRILSSIKLQKLKNMLFQKAFVEIRSTKAYTVACLKNSLCTKHICRVYMLPGQITLTLLFLMPLKRSFSLLVTMRKLRRFGCTTVITATILTNSRINTGRGFV